MLRQMVFWGATGQAKVLRECMIASGLNLVALFDNDERVTSPFTDVPIYYGRDGFERWIRSRTDRKSIGFLVAIGGDRGKDRLEIHKYLESFDLVPLIAKHARAFVAEDASVGAGSQILANSAVCVEVVLGRSCIVNTGAVVDHECRVEDGVHVGPGAQIAGCVHIGRFATIYTGASIVPRLKIGESAVIGAGAVVLEDVPPYTVVAGNPARPLKKLDQAVGS